MTQRQPKPSPAGRVLARCSLCGGLAVSKGDGSPVPITHESKCPETLIDLIHELAAEWEATGAQSRAKKEQALTGGDAAEAATLACLETLYLEHARKLRGIVYSFYEKPYRR